MSASKFSAGKSNRLWDYARMLVALSESSGCCAKRGSCAPVASIYKARLSIAQSTVSIHSVLSQREALALVVAPILKTRGRGGCEAIRYGAPLLAEGQNLAVMWACWAGLQPGVSWSQEGPAA